MLEDPALKFRLRADLRWEWRCWSLNGEKLLAALWSIIGLLGFNQAAWRKSRGRGRKNSRSNSTSGTPIPPQNAIVAMIQIGYWQRKSSICISSTDENWPQAASAKSRIGPRISAADLGNQRTQDDVKTTLPGVMRQSIVDTVADH